MRECNECNVCCVIAEVSEGEFFKPAGTSCKHYCDGCELFGKDKRPDVCNTYKCGWLHGYGNEEDRPDKSGVMISISKFNGGTWIFIQELKEKAISTTARDVIIDVINNVDLPGIVVDYNTPIGEDYGDYVIIKDKLDSRSSKIKGDHLFDLDKNIKVYRLNNGDSSISGN